MRFTSLLLAGCAVFSLSGCSDTREFMGLNNAPPDEFAVVDHPPLSMPPDYALHPPKPGEAAASQAIQPAHQAAQALYGSDKMEVVPGKGVESLGTERLSAAERALVTTSGSTQADPQIRRTLDSEASQQVVASRRLIDNIMFWRPDKAAPAAVVDPVAERQRLEAAKSKNLPVTTGGTPVSGKSGETAIQ